MTEDFHIFSFFSIYHQENIILNFIAIYCQEKIQSHSTQAPLKPITMDPHPITVPNDDDVVTVGVVFENPFL